MMKDMPETVSGKMMPPKAKLTVTSKQLPYMKGKATGSMCEIHMKGKITDSHFMKEWKDGKEKTLKDMEYIIEISEMQPMMGKMSKRVMGEYPKGGEDEES